MRKFWIPGLLGVLVLFFSYLAMPVGAQAPSPTATASAIATPTPNPPDWVYEYFVGAYWPAGPWQLKDKFELAPPCGVHILKERPTYWSINYEIFWVDPRDGEGFWTSGGGPFTWGFTEGMLDTTIPMEAAFASHTYRDSGRPYKLEVEFLWMFPWRWWHRSQIIELTCPAPTPTATPRPVHQLPSPTATTSATPAH